MSNFNVTIENISVYRRQGNLALYVIVKHSLSVMKLYFGNSNPEELYKLTKHNGLVSVDVSINRSPTSTYRGMPVPFYDVISFRLMADPSQPAIQDYAVPSIQNDTVTSDCECIIKSECDCIM